MPNRLYSTGFHIIIRKGISPADFQAILQEIAKNHPGPRLKFVKDVDKTLVVSFEADEETDKAEFERDIYRKLGELDNELRAVKEENRLYVQQLSERALPSPMIPHTNNTYYTDKVVNVNNPSQKNNENPSINVKGDFTVTASNSAVSIGDSNQVSNQISQLGETETQTRLKNLLAQLQAAIVAEPELSEEEKTKALVKVREIAEAGQSPMDGPMKKAAKRSLDVLKRITLGLSETTKLATTAKGLLDSISLLFGL